MKVITKKARKHKMWGILIGVILALGLFFYWQDNDITINHITYSNAKIPKEFSGFQIVQISDLHNKKFGENQSRILKAIKKENPDIIVITGDLIDAHRPGIENAVQLVKGARKVAPVYYVTGNHEVWSQKYKEWKNELTKDGVIFMDNQKKEVIKGKSKIALYGQADPDWYMTEYSKELEESSYKPSLEDKNDTKTLKVLLAHRPELIELYKGYGMDLVFAGHAHGGQVRLPFIGGLIAPNQGVFPKYTSGSYEVDSTTEIVSRGLGNSIIPIRVFNRPEIVVCTFE